LENAVTQAAAFAAEDDLQDISFLSP
jgi:hypothetical protein